VLDHFAVLRDEVTREDGAIVKTIGDAIMAVFRRPRPAIEAILRAQRRLADPPEGGTPLHLKAGVHHGPCIAVTMNERLDYFGSTVNLAARLEKFSTGNDVIISAGVRDDPEVADLIASPEFDIAVEAFDAPIRGFEGESVPLWRISPRAATRAGG
jgi:class 3 adenylate cyclase